MLSIQPVNQSVNQSAQSVSSIISNPVSSISESSTSQSSTSQPVNHLQYGQFNQSISRSVQSCPIQSVLPVKPANQSIGQRSIGQSINRSIAQSINRSIAQSRNRSLSQPIHPASPLSQPVHSVNQSISPASQFNRRVQPINQLTNHHANQATPTQTHLAHFDLQPTDALRV